LVTSIKPSAGMSSDQHVVRAARHANPSQLGPYLPEMRRGFRRKCYTSGLAVNWSTACAKAWMAGTSPAKTKQRVDLLRYAAARFSPLALRFPRVTISY
jgi:hypothetical protein